MKPQPVKILAGVVGISLIFLSIIQLIDSYSGLKFITDEQSGTPVTLITPDSTDPERPLILAGHGFSGSRQNLYGFALNFARAGFAVVLWDFDGHGLNEHPFPENLDGVEFYTNVADAIEIANKQGYQTERIAIMGHSMGSGVALGYGVMNPDTGSTIAVSPVPRPVSTSLPRNLLLIAGQLETPFIDNANQILQEAGGEGGSHKDGTARMFVEIPFVEHVTILFSPVAHRTALAWINSTFGFQSDAQPYTDRRVVWWGLGILGTLLVAQSIALPQSRIALKSNSPPSGWRRFLSLAAGSISATIILWLLGSLGVNFRTILGLLVGGFLLIWFAVAGITSWLISGMKPVLPSSREILSGLFVFCLLWLGIGLLTHYVWMNWWLVPKRLALWPLGTALLFPWFLFIGHLVESKKFIIRFAWWISYSVLVAAGLFLAVQLSTEISFLILILPLIPFILGLHALAAMPQRGAWAFAVSGSMWVSWAFIAVFPLR